MILTRPVGVSIVPVDHPMSPLEGEPGASQTEWVPAPDSSHLQAFRFVDRRDSSTGGPSEVWVQFRAKGNKGVTTYKYLFYNADQGEQAFQQLSGAGEPGKVIWEWRKANIPVTGPL